jgi:hypothetical protein
MIALHKTLYAWELRSTAKQMMRTLRRIYTFSVLIFLLLTHTFIAGIRVVEISVLLWSQCGSVSCGERWDKNGNPAGQV